MEISESTIKAFEDADIIVNTHTEGNTLSVSMQKGSSGVSFTIRAAEFAKDDELTILKAKFDGLKAYGEEAEVEIEILDELYEILETLNAE